jgi:GNAT superfamily N-acetyltransferase
VTLVIREIPYSAVAPWRSPAARDHVALGPTSNTTWFGAFDELPSDQDPALLAVAGLIKVGKAHRIKGVYVPPLFRGQGFGTKLTEHLIELHRDDLLEVLAYSPAFYEARGFVLVSSPREGVSRLVRRPG